LKILSKAIIATAFLLGSSVCAMADIVWTLNNVDFSDGNQAIGSFTTDNAVDTIESFTIQVIGPDTARDFTATTMSSAYLPNTIGAFLEPTYYVDLYLNSPLTSAGGTFDIGSGYDCPGCGVLLVNSDHIPSVTGVAATPEPSTIPVLGAGVVLMGMIARRKLVRAG
jgi:hypothetical protein